MKTTNNLNEIKKYIENKKLRRANYPVSVSYFPLGINATFCLRFLGENEKEVIAFDDFFFIHINH